LDIKRYRRNYLPAIFLGPPLDNPSDYLPDYIDENCEDCRAILISRCWECGAPICCPQCCDADKDRRDYDDALARKKNISPTSSKGNK